MLKIISLIENTTKSPEYRCKHGLSLYIETKKHKILFDLGQDSLFLENAKKKNIDISKIDTVIISHGHKDHGGALKEFLGQNSEAKIYIKREAFEPHYIKVLGLPFSVGLDEKLCDNKQIIFTEDKLVIDEELLLFSGVKNEEYLMQANKVLYTKKRDRFVEDNFCHEQSLVVATDDGKTLISGCSHAGIVNIMNKAEELAVSKMTTVVGGFHLYNPPTKKSESDELIDKVAWELGQRESIYYTCHCTGNKAYARMKKTLQDKLFYLSTGEEILL